MHVRKPVEEQPEIVSPFDVEGRIAFLQSERHRLLRERNNPKQNHAELDIRLSMVRAELQTLYESKRFSRESAHDGGI